MTKKITISFLLMTIVILNANSQDKVLHDVTVIDGTGSPAKTHQNVLLSGDHIVFITPVSVKIPATATVIHF